MIFEEQSVIEDGKADISFSMISENIDELNNLIGKDFIFIFRGKM